MICTKFAGLVAAATLALAPICSSSSAQTIRPVPENNASVARANNAALAYFKKGDYQRTLGALHTIIICWPPHKSDTELKIPQ